MKAEEVLREVVRDRPLDSSGWGALTDITTQDVSVSRHGLMPKLSADSGQVINGIGNWVDITSFGFDVWTWENSPALSFDEDDIQATVATHTLDWSSLVPVGTKAVIVNFDVVHGGGAELSGLRFWKGGYSAAFGVGFTTGETVEELTLHVVGQMIIPLSATRTMSWSGDPDEYQTTGSIQLALAGYIV